MKIIFTIAIIFVSFFSEIKAQQSDTAIVSFGLNSTYYYQPETDMPYMGQGIPMLIFTPTIHVRKKSHEF